MKLTTALLLSNTPLIVAFTPPRPQTHIPQQSYQFQPQHPRSQSSLPLFPDPSTLESSTLLTSELVNPFVDFLGGVSLLGSVGYGVFWGAKKSDWEYEYTPGNEEAVEKYGDKDEGLTDAQKDFFGQDDSTPSPAPPAPAETKPEPPAPAPVKPSPPSKPAKKVKKVKKVKKDPPAPTPTPPPAPTPAADTKKDIADAKKDILDNKLPTPTTTTPSKPTPATPKEPEPVPPTPTPTPAPEAAPVAETPKKKSGLKRRLAQSATFAAAAGALAITRKIVIAVLTNGLK